MGKGEIARYEQFLFFPQCFQKACFPGASKGVIVWEWVNCRGGITLQEVSFMKTLWEKEKLLMQAVSTFFSVFMVIQIRRFQS